MNPLGWTNFNLSPQGDGNFIAFTLDDGKEFQLIPARGRKLENLLQELTEAFDFNLSPQGDGN